MTSTHTDYPNKRGGTFWLRSDTSRRARGDLSLRPHQSPLLELHAPLIGGALTTESSDDRVAGYTVGGDLLTRYNVNGELDDGAPVSITDAFSYNPFAALVGKETLQGLLAFVGAHVDLANDGFTRMGCRPWQIDTWAQSAVSDRAQVPGKEAEVSLDVMSSTPSGSMRWLRVEAPSQSFSNLQRRWIMPLLNIVALATGSRPGLSQIEVATDGGPWVAVYGSSRVVDNDGPSLPIVAWADIGVTGLSTWLAKADRLRSLPSVVVDAGNWDGLTVQTRLLVLTTIAEGLHRALFGSAGGKYLERITALGQRAERIAPGVTGQLTKWARQVTDFRNEFAHRFGRLPPLSSETVGPPAAIAESIWWVLAIVLLEEAEIPETALRQRIGVNSRYGSFRRRVAAWCPEIWSDHE